MYANLIISKIDFLKKVISQKYGIGRNYQISKVKSHVLQTHTHTRTLYKQWIKISTRHTLNNVVYTTTTNSDSNIIKINTQNMYTAAGEGHLHAEESTNQFPTT